MYLCEILISGNFGQLFQVASLVAVSSYRVGDSNTIWPQKQSHRASGASPVAQAMARPIFENFLSSHMLVQPGNMCACRLQAKCWMMRD